MNVMCINCRHYVAGNVSPKFGAAGQCAAIHSAPVGERAAKLSPMSVHAWVHVAGDFYCKLHEYREATVMK